MKKTLNNLFYHFILKEHFRDTILMILNFLTNPIIASKNLLRPKEIMEFHFQNF